MKRKRDHPDPGLYFSWLHKQLKDSTAGRLFKSCSAGPPDFVPSGDYNWPVTRDGGVQPHVESRDNHRAWLRKWLDCPEALLVTKMFPCLTGSAPATLPSTTRYCAKWQAPSDPGHLAATAAARCRSGAFAPSDSAGETGSPPEDESATATSPGRTMRWRLNPVHHRHRRNHGLGVGMLGRADDRARFRQFHDFAKVHDHDAVADVLHHREIVRDEQYASPRCC